MGVDGGGESGQAFFFEPVRVSADVDNGRFVQEPVESGRSHDRIAGEDTGPVAEGFVGGEDDRQMGLVAKGDNLKEQVGLGSGQFEVTDFIEDEQTNLGQVSDQSGKVVALGRFGQFASHVHVVDKVDSGCQPQ